MCEIDHTIGELVKRPVVEVESYLKGERCVECKDTALLC